MFPTFKTQCVFKELLSNSTSLQGIISVWRDRLKNDTALQEYCLAHYGREPSIVVGCRSATAEECPAVVLRPGAKIEGAGKYHNIYKVFVDWAVINSTETVRETDGVAVKEQVGLTEVDELGQIIWNALTGIPGNSHCEFHCFKIGCGFNFQNMCCGFQNGGFQITRAAYRVDGVWFPMVTGKMTVWVRQSSKGNHSP